MFLLDDSNEVTAANKMRDVHFRFSIYMPEKKPFLYSNEIGHFVTCKIYKYKKLILSFNSILIQVSNKIPVKINLIMCITKQ